ncbi:hypothetical protein D3C75_1273510 [compost metagenome]
MIQRNRDVKAEGLFILPIVFVFIFIILGVFAQTIVDTVANALPAAVIAETERRHALVIVPVILFHQA